MSSIAFCYGIFTRGKINQCLTQDKKGVVSKIKTVQGKLIIVLVEVIEMSTQSTELDGNVD